VAIEEFNEGQFMELDYVLRERRKPAVIVCTYDAVKTQRAIISWIKEHHPQYDQEAMNLAGEKIGSLYKFIQEGFRPIFFQLSYKWLAYRPGDKIPYLIHLVNVEYALQTELESGESVLFPGINFERELIFRDFPCVLILWANRHTYERLRREAPDFWDWVTYTFHFKSPPDDLLESLGDLSKYDHPTTIHYTDVHDLRAQYERLDFSGPNREQALQEAYRIQKLIAYYHDAMLERWDSIDAYKRCLGLLDDIRADGKERLDIHWKIGRLYLLANQFSKAAHWYSECEKIIQKFDLHQVALGDVHYLLGQCYAGDREWDKALERYRTAILFYKKQGLEGSVSQVHDKMGELYFHQEQWNKALKQYAQAIYWTLGRPLPLHLYTTYAQIGLVFEQKKNWPGALLWLEKSQQCAVKFDKNIEGLEGEWAASAWRRPYENRYQQIQAKASRRPSLRIRLLNLLMRLIIKTLP
jgi:tetratricopeptide (TPR) repeat protein